MEFRLIIDEQKPESIVVTAHRKTDLVMQIQNLVQKPKSQKINCYVQDEIVQVNLQDISCIFSKNNKVYAYVQNEVMQIKHRIYQIEDLLDNSFIRLNQGCIANINEIKNLIHLWQGQ